jgi:hypothetical protein
LKPGAAARIFEGRLEGCNVSAAALSIWKRSVL